MSRCYLTTPIYYVTAKPHLGHAYTTIIGDALARWHRLLGDDVHFLTGTDEHGQKVADYAEAAGKSPQEFVDEIAPLYAQAWQRLGITNDDFIRTTEERHKIGVADLLQRCYDAGDIELDVYKGKYCVACEEYYTDDELDPGDLCRIHKRPVEYYEEENYFFRLSRFQDRLLQWYDAHPGAIKPEFRGNEALGLIRGGLRDFSVSRTSLKWGIPLPWDPKHVAYVWFDALSNYITAIGYGSDEERFNTWWPGTHLIGKDIIRHHCVYWPAMLMSAGLEPPAGWAVGGWLLVGGEKMSKSKLTGISPDQIVDDFGSDAFRYYFLRAIQFGQDGSFSWEDMAARYTAELANGLGNLASRATAMVVRYRGGVLPGPGDYANADLALQELLAACAERADAAMLQLDFSTGILAIKDFVDAVNVYVTEQEPWVLAKDPASAERLDTVLYTICESLRAIAVLYHPVMPKSTAKIWESLGQQAELAEQPVQDVGRWGQLRSGSHVVKGESLFPRLETP